MTDKFTPEFNYYPVSIELDMGMPSPANPQANTPAVAIENSNILNSANGSVVGTGTVQSPNFLAGTSGAGWRLDSNGNLEASDGTFRGSITGATGTFSGTITASTGTIGGWSIDGTSIYTGTEDHAGYTANAGDLTIYSDGANASIHAKEFYIDANGAIFATSATLSGAITTGVGSSIVSDYLSGIIAQANLNVSNRGWSQTCAFSVTDADTVAWGAGTFTSADGTAYSITGANTGNMAAKTYIYLDTAVSTTVYQTTTTATTAVGIGKVLIAIAQNGTTEATYKVMSGQGGENIDAANIVTGSITANEIAASTITAGKMSVSTLSSIVADLGAITAGTITVDSAGHIKGGQTAYNTGTGFFLGYSTDAYKFSIGNSTNYLTWNGTNLILKAVLEMLGTLQLKSYTVANLPAGNTGWKDATGNAVYSGAWLNPTNAYSSDDSRATGVLPGGSPAGRDHKWNTFGFSIPANSTITGIEVKLEHYVSAASATYYRTFIYSTSTGWVVKDLTQQLAESYETMGSSSDLWGATWSVDDFSNANFEVRVYVFGSTGMTAYLDHITVKVHYSDPTTPLSAGAVSYASNGRKNGEGAGVGTGVLVFYDGSNWIACDTGQTVAA